MEALIFFLLWAGFLFLMMRFGCGAHVMGHGSGKARRDDKNRPESLRWVPPETDVDPVCGKRIDTVGARPSVHDGYVYYFCSRECREVFEAAPHIHVGHASTPGRRKLEHNNV